MKELVSVIIPVPNPDLSPTQERILHHCLEALANYTIIFVTFEKADLGIIKDHRKDIDVIYFPKEYFQSRQTLAKLFLMEDFYEQFSWANFLLMHELNSWIIKDELHHWCKQGYDYLKAAPITKNKSVNTDFVSGISQFAGLNSTQKQSLGNSFQDNGLYLCLVERMIKILKSKEKTAYQYRHNNELSNRDSVFWEIEANRFWPNLRKPSRIVQNYFAQYADNQIINKLNIKEKLPFALTGINSTNIDGLPYFK